MITDRAVSVVLADGEVVRIRTLRPADADDVVALHRGLDDHDRYLRFFGAAPSGLEGLARKMAAETGVRHAAVGAFRRDRLIGVAHYEATTDPTEAEVALAVDSSAQAHGVGTLMLEYLVSVARSYGIRRLTGQVLAENTRMFGVFTDLGLPFRATPGGPEREFVLSLEPGEPYWDALNEREREADIASLRAVLRPASVAVIGASRRPGAVGHAVLKNVLDGGYSGDLFAVNPAATEILGVPCAPSVAELPSCPELVVVCVPAAAVPDAIIHSGECGVRAAVVISAGLTGTDAGERVIEAARKYGMRLVGPNCVGVANTDGATRLNATFVPGVVPAGAVGVVSQSGGFGIALLESLRQLGVGVSSMVSTGDKYDVSGNDLLMWWQRDPGTEIAVLYLESFGNPRKFGRLARALAATKPVLAIRTGSTEVARRAAASHTAAAATPAVTRDALYEQAGVIAVDTVTELVDAIAALSWQPLPGGNRVAVVSNAGGAGVLAADACARSGLALPELGADTTARLRALLSGQASVSNPVDTTAAVSAEVFGACLDVLLADDAVDAVIAAAVPTALGDPVDAVRELPAGTKPVLAVRFGQLAHVEPLMSPAGRPATAAYADPAGAAAVLGHLASYAEWRRHRGPVVAPDLPGIDPQRAIALLRERPAGWLDPLTVTELLDCFGIPSVPTRFAADEDAAAKAFAELGGPVAVKATVEGMVHKSAHGGVALGVSDENAVRDVVRRWRNRFGAAWKGAVVQPMSPPGRELLAGIAGDEVFGPLVVFGLGGVDTDLVADRAARLAPLTERDAELLVHGLRSSPGLFGDDAGSGRLDTAAIGDVLLRVSRLAELLPEVAELDLNPLVAWSDGCVALDARIRVEPRTPNDPFLRRLRT
ncbi:bifunctional acetate--CoA ligase family protein/GNAT family N-acetyltransferase [Amycolatopsis pigmentata]|uniref:GNAT family N-acetyltransferase n=1 Tax=Amycolatopsis pigmentata TaxID=450801 RepID=A0ABW5FQG7_9PSEU